jgi:2,4-dienoyl-CoA reductase-like NADH-dependent reductase (Old Yellow Enzyme family)
VFVAAAWRGRAAGCAWVVLDGAVGSLLHQLHTPLVNQRADEYGGLGRLRLATEIVEAIRRWLGPQFLIGYRLVVDELRPDGITLHESRVGAHQLVSAGINLLDIVVTTDPDQLIAYFPGWQIPLVESIRGVVDVPLIANGTLGDAELAESILVEGSADLIGLAQTLTDQPDWPAHAVQTLDSVASAL